MIMVCAWCGKKLKASRAGCRGGVSYGICLPCVRSILNDSPWLMKEYVDQMDSPVALVTPDGVVMTANGLACALLKKDLAQIEGAGCGELFGCASPGEACGAIAGCPGCKLRRCVAHTHRTGKGFSEITTDLGRDRAQGQPIWWTISTSKFLDCVLLKISSAISAEGVKQKRSRPACGEAAADHSSGQRAKRGTSSPSGETTVSQNISSGLTQRPPSP